MSEGYLGNRLLKRANTEEAFTPEQVEEFIKCMDDPVYFTKKYVKIVNVDEGLVNFTPYDYQEEIINTIHKNRFVICKMARQSGKSTAICCGNLLHYALFNPNVSVGVLANKMSTATELMGRIQFAYEHLPKWLQQGVTEWNKTTIEFENGSRIKSATTSSSSIRGMTFNFLMLDEFAFVPENMAEKFVSSTFPTISSGKTTKMVIVSTPNGMNMFYKFWRDAEIGRSDYIPINIPWQRVPGRDEEWKESTIRNECNGDIRKFKAEYECEFMGSMQSLIDPYKVNSLSIEKPIEQSNLGLDIYEEPIEDHQYIICVDTAKGIEGDYSAFVVIDMTETPYRVVAKFRNNQIPPETYPEIIDPVGRQYNDAFVLAESNESGSQVVDILYTDYEYENIMMTSSRGARGQVLGEGFGSGGRTKFGVQTSKAVKRIGCSALKSLIEQDKLVPRDAQLISELSTFVAKKQSYEAEKGYHDDLVMCLVLFAWASTQAYFQELTDNDVRRDVYKEYLEKMQEDIMTMGFFDDGKQPERFVDGDGTVWEEQKPPPYNEFGSNW